MLNVIELEKPDGVIMQFGGQTPLKLALPLEKAGVPIGDLAGLHRSRRRPRPLRRAARDSLDIAHPQYATAVSVEEALEVAKKIGFPLMVRPSYVLGGRAMEIVYDMGSLEKLHATRGQGLRGAPRVARPLPGGRLRVDVDAISDGERTEVCGLMQHIEEAGVHSGDSMAVLPPYLLSREQRDDIIDTTRTIAGHLKVKGIINIQFAILYDTLYILEVNPRASRTVPFVSKATGIPVAKLAVQVMAEKKLDDLGARFVTDLPYVAVKESVFPFDRFDKADVFSGRRCAPPARSWASPPPSAAPS